MAQETLVALCSSLPEETWQGIDGNGRTRLELSDDDGFYLVKTGSLNLFALPLQHRSEQAPMPLGSITQGTLLPTFDARDKTLGLFAVAAPGSEVLHLEPTAMVGLSADQTVLWTAALEQWIRTIRVVTESPYLASEQLRGSNQPWHLEPGKNYRCAETVWVNAKPGMVAEFGAKDDESLPHGPLPLPPRIRFHVLESMELEATALDRLPPDGLRPGLLWLLRRWTQTAMQRIQAHNERDARAIEDKSQAETLSMRGTVGILSGLIPIAGRKPVVEPHGTPLLDAVQLVTNRLDLDYAEALRQQARMETTETPLHTRMRLLMTAIGLRYRKVQLRGDWYRQDQGPLIGERIGDGRPVALTPAGTGRYQVWSDGRSQAVDAQVAEELEGHGWVLYPPLDEKVKTAGAFFSWQLGRIRSDRQRFTFMALAAGILGLAPPLFSHLFFDQVIGAGIPAEAWLLMALGFGVIAGQGMFEAVKAAAVVRIEGSLFPTLEASIWDRLLRLPVTFFRKYSVGDLTSRVLGLYQLRTLISGNLIPAFGALLTGIFSLGLMFWYSLWLSLVALIPALIGIPLLWWVSRQQNRLQSEWLEQQAGVENLLFNLISGIQKLRLFGAENRALHQWAQRFHDQKLRSIRLRTLNYRVLVVADGAIVAGTFLIYWYIYFRLKDLPMGEFVGFSVAYMQFTTALVLLVANLSMFNMLGPQARRVVEVLAQTPETTEGKRQPGNLRGELRIQDLCFRYVNSGPLILDQVNIEAEPGEYVAIVGSSGSGKSTLFRLLLGFETPESGAVFYDGKELAKLDIQSVRRQLGVVLQDSALLTGSILENILGAGEGDVDEAWIAAEQAGIAEDIRSMPMGMQTILMEEAGTISSGQKQRLMIARALIRKPIILILDEATSALDNRSQQRVTESLEKLAATRIVVAHRLSTIQNADRIYVLEGGRVVETGNYIQLMAARGPFYTLAKRQLAT